MFKKRGISHLELITAILIFIFAVGVIIYFVNITIKTETQKPLLEVFESKLREKAEINFKEISLFIKDGYGDCFNLSLHSDLQQGNENLTFMKDETGGVAFNFSNGWLLINNTGQNFYRIYSFPVNVTKEIRLNDMVCNPLIERQDYNYSITYYGKIFTEKNLLQLKQKYDNEYRELRKEFNIGNKDFAIIVKNLIEMKKPIPKQIEVQAKEFPVEIILESGDIVKTTINIQIW